MKLEEEEEEKKHTTLILIQNKYDVLFTFQYTEYHPLL